MACGLIHESFSKATWIFRIDSVEFLLVTSFGGSDRIWIELPTTFKDNRKAQAWHPQALGIHHLSCCFGGVSVGSSWFWVHSFLDLSSGSNWFSFTRQVSLGWQMVLPGARPIELAHLPEALWSWHIYLELSWAGRRVYPKLSPWLFRLRFPGGGGSFSKLPGELSLVSTGPSYGQDAVLPICSSIHACLILYRSRLLLAGTLEPKKP